MTDNLRSVLFQTAGFLTMIVKGYVPAQPATVQEAKELLEKIGVHLAEAEQ